MKNKKTIIRKSELLKKLENNFVRLSELYDMKTQLRFPNAQLLVV